MALIIFIFALSLASPTFSFAHAAVENNTVKDEDHTAREEAEGKALWERLQAKELSCEDLSDEDFGSLGEYFMGQMASDSHQAMNNMMIQMMDEEGEEQMHTAMGKRMSDCEPNASIPQGMMGNGMMSMMNMMMGGGGNPMPVLSRVEGMGNFGTNPIGWFGWGFGWIFMILFWSLVILAIVALIKWIASQGKSQRQEKSALDILKERYAKGEIDKKEFEKIKKDLV